MAGANGLGQPSGKQYQYVLFDLDGTLLDTYNSMKLSLRQMERQAGLNPVPEENLGRFIGPPFLPALCENYGVEVPRAQELAAIFRRVYAAEGIYQTRLYPKVLPLLQALRNQNIRLGIASMKSAAMAEKEMKLLGLEPYFEHVACTRGTVATKQSLIEEALSAMGRQPIDDAVLVGDTNYDAVGAVVCGIDFVAQLYGYGFASGHATTRDMQAVLLARTPEELYDFLVYGKRHS